MDTTIVTIPACPSWCALPAGHEFEDTLTEGGAKSYGIEGSEGDTPYRAHISAVTATAWVALGEVVYDGQVLTGTPVIHHLSEWSEDLTAADARSFAAELNAAAEIVEAYGLRVPADPAERKAWLEAMSGEELDSYIAVLDAERARRI